LQKGKYPQKEEHMENEQQFARDIATTIQQQLMVGHGKIRVMSWGQHALQAVTQKDLESLGITNGLGGLKFKVKGHHHKGHVLVVLNGVDLYDVYICSIQKGEMIIKETEVDLYCDQIGYYIDEKVEKIKEYSF